MTRPVKVRRRRAWLIIIVLGLLIWAGYDFYRSVTRLERGENVPSVPWLPEAATNVSFYRAYGFTAYEFDIPEQEFLRWAEDEGWDVRPIEGEVVVQRYSMPDAGDSGPGEGLPHDATAEQVEAALEAYWSARRAIITDGYVHERRRPGDLAGRTVAYDRDAGRAYYSHTLR